LETKKFFNDLAHINLLTFLRALRNPIVQKIGYRKAVKNVKKLCSTYKTSPKINDLHTFPEFSEWWKFVVFLKFVVLVVLKFALFNF
jgi:hypothetical protein